MAKKAKELGILTGKERHFLYDLGEKIEKGESLSKNQIKFAESLLDELKDHGLYIEGETNLQKVAEDDITRGKHLHFNNKFTEAIQCFMKKAMEGDAESQYYLANCYEETKDFVKAVDWYQKSVQQNNKDALCGLGNLYLEGYVVDKDVKKALS